MFTVLLESRAVRARSLGSTVASAMLHGVILAGAVALTLPDRGNATSPPIDVSPVKYVRIPARPPAPAAPPSAPVQPSQLPRPDFPIIAPPIVTPTTLPPVDVGPALPPDQLLLGRRSGAAAFDGAAMLGPELGSGDVADATAVDRAPRTVGRVEEPRYPARLRASGVEGVVIAEFVVDTLGRAELDGLRFPVTASPLFDASVREALGRYRFLPGEIAGRKVRTRVQLPFEFRLTR